MSESRDEGDDVDEQVPEAVRDWLRSLAAERGVPETELLRSLLADNDGGDGVDREELDRVEREFQELVEDVRERIVQVKREADGKASAEHSHQELRSTLEQVGREVGSLAEEVERLERSVDGGFDNYEEILTHLDEATATLDRKLGRLASAVIDLRGRVADVSRDEARRTALAHLTDTANRHGVVKAKCEACGEGVHVGMLVQPRCPHCDTSFTSLEPRGGFFRKSVLHTGTMPALESGREELAEEAETLEEMVEAGERAIGGTPTFDTDEGGTGPEEVPPAAASDAGETEPAEPADGAGIDGHRDLEDIDGVGPAYADRLEAAGIDDLSALAVADPGELGDAIDVPVGTVAEWVAQAEAMTSAG